MNEPNQVICPECGKVRMETPPGTTALPTLGMAMKASGAAGPCGCGKSAEERAAMLAGDVATPTRPASDS